MTNKKKCSGCLSVSLYADPPRAFIERLGTVGFSAWSRCFGGRTRLGSIAASRERKPRSTGLKHRFWEVR